MPEIAFMGDTKGDAFDITLEAATAMLDSPLNLNGRPNSDVERPWVNGLDITRQPRGMWVIDFDVNMTEEKAALYEMAFESVRKHVKPERDQNKRAAYRDHLWIHAEARSAMCAALAAAPRYSKSDKDLGFSLRDRGFSRSHGQREQPAKASSPEDTLNTYT